MNKYTPDVAFLVRVFICVHADFFLHTKNTQTLNKGSSQQETRSIIIGIILSDLKLMLTEEWYSSSSTVKGSRNLVPALEVEPVGWEVGHPAAPQQVHPFKENFRETPYHTSSHSFLQAFYSPVCACSAGMTQDRLSAPIGCLASDPLWSVSAGSGRLHFICSLSSKFSFYLKTLWTFGLMTLSECPLWRK